MAATQDTTRTEPAQPYTPGTRIRGVVKWFRDEKGYGFIAPDGRPDVFVHYASIIGKGFKSLPQGAVVEFEIAQSEKGEKAINVVVIPPQ